MPKGNKTDLDGKRGKRAVRREYRKLSRSYERAIDDVPGTTLSSRHLPTPSSGFSKFLPNAYIAKKLVEYFVKSHVWTREDVIGE